MDFISKTTELRNVNKLFYILICQEDFNDYTFLNIIVFHYNQQ